MYTQRLCEYYKKRNSRVRLKVLFYVVPIFETLKR